MTLHDACTSGTSRVLIVASLQRLKVEALIPAPAGCEMRSLIKFLNAQNIQPIEIDHQLCQVYDHTRLDGQHISYRSSAGRCSIIIHPRAWTSRPVIFSFSYTSRNYCPVASTFSEWQRGWDEYHSGSNPRKQTSTTHDTKDGPAVWQMSQFRRWIGWKVAQHLLYLLQ